MCMLNTTKETVALHHEMKISELERVDSAANVGAIYQQADRVSHISSEKLDFLWRMAQRSSNDLTETQRREFFVFLLEYEGIFSMSSADLGHT